MSIVKEVGNPGGRGRPGNWKIRKVVLLLEDRWAHIREDGPLLAHSWRVQRLMGWAGV